MRARPGIYGGNTVRVEAYGRMANLQVKGEGRWLNLVTVQDWTASEADWRAFTSDRE